MGNLEEKASKFAISAHSRINQLRKYSQQPYDVHLRAVARLVASVGSNEPLIAAAWLHDTVEDTPATFEDLEREFGTEVTELVKQLTDVSKPSDGNRAARKAIDRQHLAGASPGAKTVKLADLIDNCEDICRNDSRFGRLFLLEMQSLLEVLADGDKKLYGKAVETVMNCSKKINQETALQEKVTENTLQLFRSAFPKKLLPGQRGIRLFTEAFAARDLQEPLLSFDAKSLENPEFGRTFAANKIIGIRRNGVVTGYFNGDDFHFRSSPEERKFDSRQVVDLEASLTDVIHVLTHFNSCFVSLDGTVVGVISREGMENPVVRMWLFGIITMIEMLAVNLIRQKCPDNNDWKETLSSGRLEKATRLKAERERRGLTTDLLDCLQFSDKIQLLLKDPAFLEGSGFPSSGAAKRALKDLESLRDDLAHGQDITRHDWVPILRLAQRIEHLCGN
ncbi:MAG: HD domain-containing protein [Synergistales bacterium]